MIAKISAFRYSILRYTTTTNKHPYGEMTLPSSSLEKLRTFAQANQLRDLLDLDFDVDITYKEDGQGQLKKKLIKGVQFTEINSSYRGNQEITLSVIFVGVVE
jgi:hypothetical protein